MAAKDKNIKADKKYLPRDISWMYFNHRILEEAKKPQVPLLERMTFLGIYSNNLDEFFRVRVASQSRIAECEAKEARSDRNEALKILKEINRLNNQYAHEYEAAIDTITEELKEEGIFLQQEDELDEAQRQVIYAFYRKNLSGHVLPVWLPAAKQLEKANDENIYLAVKMRSNKISRRKPEYAYLELPVNLCGRFIHLNEHDGKHYLIYLDDAIRCCLPLIFSGQDYTDFEAYAFKFTRDAEMEIDNDLRNGMLQKISKGVKSRKKGAPLRIQYDARMPKALLKLIMTTLYVDKLDTVQAGGRYYNHKDLMQFPDCGRKDLKYPAWPAIHRQELEDPQSSLLEKIRERDRFLHVPYHSFDAYLRLLQEAAINKDVKSIKITLYRLAKDSKVIEALIAAARNGKKVTVVIELLARFDEASNINWSKKMQDAGIHVIFGVEGLKIHSKITWISMKNNIDLACISTGNFHEGNARMYTDCILMTASRPIVREVDQVFRFIEKPYSQVRFKELLVSPNEMKIKFLKLIQEEIKNAALGKPAYIRAKVNHITDPEIMDKLYEAAAAGVSIQLLVRGNCSLIPGQKKLNNNIMIRGIIDRYLEHARIFIFAAGGKEKIFMGSADWMTRNLDHRIEVITPVYDVQIQEELKRIVDYGLKDNKQGRLVNHTEKKKKNEASQNDKDIPETEAGVIPGLITPVEKPVENFAFRSQEALYEYYRKQENEAMENKSLQAD